MTDVGKLLKTLHPLERRILPHLKDKSMFEELVRESSMKDVEVMRALQWLQNKDVLKIEETADELIDLDKNGFVYKEKGLPEIRFLRALKDTSKEKTVPVSEIRSVDKDELNICIGLLKRKVAIDILKQVGLSVYITEQGKRMLAKKSLEEKFLDREFPVALAMLSDEEKFAYDELRSRKQIVKKDVRKTRIIMLTSLGKELIKKSSKLKTKDEIGRITPQMLKDSSWKKKNFRAYDIKASLPALYPGKRHFVNQAIEYIKQIWLDMGFIEMKGNEVQTAFWDLDALYVPQDHPAREMQDTFYLGRPSHGKLPVKFKDKVKAVHEDGGDTGSKGWQYNFDEKVSKQLLLRTHTTVLSALQISKLKPEDLPLKFFSVGKVYRNEALDWKHLFEFYQVEGIVIDPDANLKHLKGYLEEFYKKMGYPKVRIRPSHFPYTEPSAEVDVFHPKKKEWVELGGSGIFRPEVVKPLLGISCPVLAWGLGMERIISEYFDLTDIRDLYNNDLKKIREMKQWMR